MTPYSRTRVAGSLVFVSGQLGWKHEKFSEGIVAQTELPLQNVETCLAEHGLDRTDVIKATVFLALASDWGIMNQPYLEFFSDPLPARTTVGVQLKPGALVEVEAVAMLRADAR